MRILLNFIFQLKILKVAEKTPVKFFFDSASSRGITIVHYIDKRPLIYMFIYIFLFNKRIAFQRNDQNLNGLVLVKIS